jgi:hypothetical protein
VVKMERSYIFSIFHSENDIRKFVFCIANGGSEFLNGSFKSQIDIAT